jgi:His-Xaa-Ser system radical SAM maturase HxsB
MTLKEQKYETMPFLFQRENNDIFITTRQGDFFWLSRDDFNNLLEGNISSKKQIFQDLISRQIISIDRSQSVDVAAAKLRSRKNFLREFTSLHMLVTTLRCNQRCEYCQASCEENGAIQFDMDIKTAKKIVETIFKTPSTYIKIEFQGGEPTLNWDVIPFVIEYAKELNQDYKKILDFVVCSNMTAMSAEKFQYLKKQGVYLSTSLDGPKVVHDTCRKLRDGESSYDLFAKKLEIGRHIMGTDNIDALMTTSKFSLEHYREIIDEYIRLGFHGIFLRSLNPYGFAAEQTENLGYSPEEFFLFYVNCLEYILDVNAKGTPFTEFYTALIFKRIMSSESTGFVDLQSPSGAGISGAIYDYNGDVYPADEGRMLSRMGDQRFKMGNVFKNTYKDIFSGKVIQEIVEKSCLETIPGCSDCVYSPYCGADPIRNYLEYGSVIGHNPGSNFCKKNMSIFNYIFQKIKNDDEKFLNSAWRWISPLSNQDLIYENV